MIKGTIYLTISRMFLVLSGFLLNVVLGRWLGPEQFGIFGIINSIITVVELILLSSLAKGVSRSVAEDEQAARSIINDGLRIQALSGFVIFVALFFGAGLIAHLLRDQGLAIYFKMLAVLIPLAGLAFVYESALNGVRAFGRQAIVVIIFHITRLVASVFLVYIGLSIKGAVLGLIVADIVRLFVGRYFCRGLKGRGDYKAKGLAKFGLQTAMLSFSAVLLINIDIMAVKMLLKEGSYTGFYNAALTISRMPSFMVGALGVTLFPHIVKSISENNEELTRRYINQTLKYVVLFTIPLTFLISATSESLTSLIYGNVYLASARPLSILTFGWAFLSLNMMFNTIILASNKPHVAVIIGLFLVPCSILLNVILIPRIGIEGAAIATTITYFVSCVLAGGYVLVRFRTLIQVPSLIRIVAASSVVYLLALLYSLSGVLLFVNYIVLSGVFFFLLILFKEITVGEIRVVKDNMFRIVRREKAAI